MFRQSGNDFGSSLVICLGSARLHGVLHWNCDSGLRLREGSDCCSAMGTRSLGTMRPFGRAVRAGKASWLMLLACKACGITGKLIAAVGTIIICTKCCNLPHAEMYVLSHWAVVCSYVLCCSCLYRGCCIRRAPLLASTVSLCTEDLQATPVPQRSSRQNSLAG